MSEEEETLEGFQISPTSVHQGVRTFFIFLDLPQHLEFRVGEMPLLPQGIDLELDLCLRHPRNPKKTRRINGPYTVVRRVLKFSSSQPKLMGLSQYIELSPVVDQK